MSRNRPARTLPASPSLKSLIDEHYKQSESIVIGARKYTYKCTHCPNKHHGFQRERTEVWQHIKSRAHLNRCPEDKTRFARWLPTSTSDVSSQSTEGLQETNAVGKAEENASDDSSAGDPSVEPEPQTAGLTALAVAAEAVEDKEKQGEREKAADGAAAAETTHEDADDAETTHGDEVADDSAEDDSADEDVDENAAKTAHEEADDDGNSAETPSEETTPQMQSPEGADVTATPIKLTKQDKTGKINEFIDKVLPATPEFAKLRSQRNATSGWTIELNSLAGMFANWLEVENISNWKFSSELIKSLDSNKSLKIQCDRPKDKPRQRLLKKKL